MKREKRNADACNQSVDKEPDMKKIKIISERVFKAGYVLRKELIEPPCAGDDPDEPYEWTRAYNPHGDYIGNPSYAHWLCAKLGIQPITSEPDDNVCCIGFSIKDGKWYGWSHRARHGFKIGSTCKKGDAHYRAGNLKDEIEDAIRFWSFTGHSNVKARKVEDGLISVTWKYGKTCPNKELHNQVCEIQHTYNPEQWGRGEWTAKTVEDAKQMACDFAEGVS